MSHLNQRLLNNLDNHYNQIAAVFIEGEDREDIISKLQLSENDMLVLRRVMFDPKPIYTVNRNGKKVRMRFCADTFNSREIENEKC